MINRDTFNMSLSLQRWDDKLYEIGLKKTVPTPEPLGQNRNG